MILDHSSMNSWMGGNDLCKQKSSGVERGRVGNIM